MNEIDLGLERSLRTHFRDARSEDPTPSSLRTAVLAIPAVTATPSRSWTRYRAVTLLAATIAVGTAAAGWALLGGSLPPAPDPSPPAVAVEASPVTTPRPSALPPEPSRSPGASDAPGPVVPDGTGPAIAAGWLPAGTMHDRRALATATLLQDGRVLVIGGYAGSSLDGLASAEIWDPATRTFTPTGSMERPRVGHAATLLNDGRVLVVGGQDRSVGKDLDTEVWDPATGTFEVVGTMPALPSGITATTLLDGRVLIVGSDVCLVPRVPRPSGNVGLPVCRGSTASTRLWSPDGSWVVGPPLNEQRSWHTATRLPDGQVVLIGNPSWGVDTPESTEVYDPATNTFVRVGELLDYVIGGHTATLLGDGRVLITGGDTDDPSSNKPTDDVLRDAEVWDPATGGFAPAGRMDLARRAHDAALLPDGRVLVAGGSGRLTASFHVLGTATTEIWDPATATFSPGPSMADPRERGTLVTLRDGSLLVIGGNRDSDARNDVGQALDSAEILDFSAAP